MKKSKLSKASKPARQSHPRLREALKLMSLKTPVKNTPKAFKMIVWELMRTQTELLKLSSQMKKAK